MKKLTLALIILLLTNFMILAGDAEKKEDKSPWKSSTFSGLKFRSLGPAFTSGRIADFAVNPNNHSEYYVAAASGHIWKTTNSGTTWKPVFDHHGAYSIGCLRMDPNNSNVIWAGTGENNHQRALGYGNGVYRSSDGGESWKIIAETEDTKAQFILPDAKVLARVRAIKDKPYDESAWSDVLEIDARLPEKVKNLRWSEAEHLGEMQALIEWDAAERAESYEIDFNPVGRDGDVYDVGDKLFVYWSILSTPGTYKYKVRAKNVFGAGDWSDELTIVVE